jgi:PIN domain nuclease of toxin-antitoxin system
MEFSVSGKLAIRIAQADRVPLVSNDTALDGYGVKRIW